MQFALNLNATSPKTIPTDYRVITVYENLVDINGFDRVVVTQFSGYFEPMKNPKIINVNDKMQTGYSYELTAKEGDFPPEFAPALTPPKMLELGVFEGKYMNDCTDEFPAHWFENAKISDKSCIENNCFQIKSRQPLSVWKEKGWLIEPDPRGWFQWYCRYYMGRRIAGVDAFQIKRWRAFTRHKAQVEKNCELMDLDCRPRQRQALLQWAYDPFF